MLVIILELMFLFGEKVGPLKNEKKKDLVWLL